ncbi:phospholipase D-like domain-containing protein [Echinicola sp. 20G]|uniref:phospholipase D-like domain-containing protein n=1 Tax=Echinicola sp. 20G TaxID=2781961 RepID=UPI001910942A|nr:phospholipase D-like domain-containing protein [Echinicola sp. 20G]
MIQAYFSCSDDPVSLQERVLMELDAVLDWKEQHVQLDLMVFSFTDELIYRKLRELLLLCPRLEIRILADWGNISSDKDRKLLVLVEEGHPNLHVRLKYDFPYHWNEDSQKLEWDYKASYGFLHHKTLMVSVESEAKVMLAGSYNWTKKSNRSYENLLKITASSITDTLFDAFRNEFNAIWEGGGLSLTFFEAQEHVQMIEAANRKGYFPNPAKAIAARMVEDQFLGETRKRFIESDSLVAFSGMNPFDQKVYPGFAFPNRTRKFLLKKDGGSEKEVPLDITTVSLDIIKRAIPQTVLKVAMFALSARVAEFNALLEAARRGVQVKVILDRGAGKTTADRLQEIASREHIPITVKMGKRMMHQKYIVDFTHQNVMTGTANMTIDAIGKHAEHRFLLKNNPVAQSFSDNFDMMWERIE